MEKGREGVEGSGRKGEGQERGRERGREVGEQGREVRKEVGSIGLAPPLSPSLPPSLIPQICRKSKCLYIVNIQGQGPSCLLSKTNLQSTRYLICAFNTLHTHIYNLVKNQHILWKYQKNMKE